MEKELVDYIIKQAIQQATTPITVSIVNESGRLVSLYRAPGCSSLSLEVSRQKAITASQFRMPTHVIGEMSQKFPVIQAHFHANSEFSTLPSGFPLLQGRRLLGGIGIAGGKVEQDQTIGAKAAQIDDYYVACN